VCDLETSRMGAPYIYDISRLRVNNGHTHTHTQRFWLNNYKIPVKTQHVISICCVLTGIL